MGFTSNGASSANVDEPKPEEEEEEEDEYCTLLPCLPRIKISYPEKPETCSFLGCLHLDHPRLFKGRKQEMVPCFIHCRNLVDCFDQLVDGRMLRGGRLFVGN